MNRPIESMLQLITILVILISFMVPENYLENTRFNYIVFLVKNSLFEISILILINLIVLIRKNKSLLAFLNSIKMELKKTRLFQKLLIVNIGILIIVLCGTIIYISNKRAKVYKEMTINYYQQGQYEYSIYSKKGDLNNAILSLNSLSVAFNETNISENSILNSMIDKLEFKKTLSQRFYKRFEESYFKNGLTRINFMLLLQAYCLHPYNILIEGEVQKQIDYIIRAFEQSTRYYSHLVNNDLEEIKIMNEEYPNFYIEPGILNSNINSKKYFNQINQTINSYSKEEFQHYVNNSWQLDKILNTVEKIQENKSIDL